MKFETFGLSGFESALSAIERAIHSREMLDEVGVTVAENLRAGFVTGMSPYGVRWLPLKYRRGAPLRDTGRLMNSITHRVTGDGVEVGTNVVYAPIHQFGANVLKVRLGSKQASRGARIPARPFFPTEAQGLPPAWQSEIAAIVARHLSAGSDGGVSGQGLSAGVAGATAALSARLSSGGGR